MGSGVCGRFAALLLCHATTYAAPVLATTPMDGAEFSVAVESARQASEADFRTMRNSTLLLANDNNVAHGHNKDAAFKTGGVEAKHGAAQMQQFEHAKYGTADWCDLGAILGVPSAPSSTKNTSLKSSAALPTDLHSHGLALPSHGAAFPFAAIDGGSP